MKKILMIICLIILVAFITVLGSIFIDKNVLEDNVDFNASNNEEIEEEKYPVSSYITNDVVENTHEMKSVAIFKDSYTPEFMLENADIVALATIVTIDGASTEYNSMFGMTYGSMLINSILVGENVNSTILEYIKPGGVMSLAEWEKTQPESANQKRDYLRQQSGNEIDKNTTYIKNLLGNDIDLEAGKTYLVYLNYSDVFQKYEIIGLGNGLREVDIQQVSSASVQNYDLNSLNIKNNDTGEWESLNNYIQENITELQEK